ncbi:MAG: stage II sporulation protein D [Sporolactobacillus sp.]
MKNTFLIAACMLLLVVCLPAIIVLPFRAHLIDKQAQPLTLVPETKAHAPRDITVNVLRVATNSTEHLVLDRYLIGVVAAEMPADFPKEALKAQALAARTYILSQLRQTPDKVVTDTVKNQAYLDDDELRKAWGNEYERRMARIRSAVFSTKGQVITYQGKLITPEFFSTSNGETENAENYWQHAVPYLCSVASPWDKASPKYINVKQIPVNEVDRRLGVTLARADGEVGRVLKQTPTGHIAIYQIGSESFSGRVVREKLDLSSTDFSLVRKGHVIVSKTIGSGHDVGMSQYGAAGMAKEGKNASQIVTYYYTGTTVTHMPEQTATALAKLK